MTLISYVKTTVLLAVMTALLLGVGFAVGGSGGLMIALILSGIMNIGSYFYSDKLVLRMYKAQELSRSEYPRIYETVEKLRMKMELPMPKLYLVPSETPNAFATGRNPEHAVVAVTSGITDLLSEEELEGVLAHELAHVKNRDILISSVSATIAGAIAFVGEMLFYSSLFGRENRNIGAVIIGMILAPIAAVLVQMAISRGREFVADATAAQFTNPLSLASALQKLAYGNQARPMTMGSRAQAHQFIIPPFKMDFMAKLFSTHPPLEERIERLQGLM